MNYKTQINATIRQENRAFLDKVYQEIGTSSKSQALDLILDIVQGTSTMDMIRVHYDKVFDKVDGRSNGKRWKVDKTDQIEPKF